MNLEDTVLRNKPSQKDSYCVIPWVSRVSEFRDRQ